MKIKQTAIVAAFVVSLAVMSVAAACESGSVSAAPVTGVTLDKTDVSIHDMATLKINAAVTPNDATNKTVTWSSSDTAVATVNSGGVVFPEGSGVATITVTTVDGGYTASCEVTVIWEEVTGITIDRTSATVIVGETLWIHATLSPSDSTDWRIEWTSSDPAVVLVDSDQSETPRLEFLKTGVATVTAKPKGKSMTAACVITVTGPVTGVALDKTDTVIAVGNTSQLTATVSPETAINKTVTWTSSDTTVADVDSNGEVTAMNVGTAVITATTVDGDKTAACSVTVSASVTEAPPESDSGGGTMLYAGIIAAAVIAIFAAAAAMFLLPKGKI